MGVNRIGASEKITLTGSPTWKRATSADCEVSPAADVYSPAAGISGLSEKKGSLFEEAQPVESQAGEQRGKSKKSADK